MIIPEGQVIDMSYAKYSKELKKAVIVRMLEGDETVTDIQRDTGIGINTLYRKKNKRYWQCVIRKSFHQRHHVKSFQF